MKKEPNTHKINQIPISRKSLYEYVPLISFMLEKGFTAADPLMLLKAGGNPGYPSAIPAVIVDLRTRSLWPSGVMSMACWCTTHRRRYPLDTASFLEHYEKLVEEQDAALYDALLRESYRKRYGPPTKKDEGMD